MIEKMHGNIFKVDNVREMVIFFTKLCQNSLNLANFIKFDIIWSLHASLYHLIRKCFYLLPPRKIRRSICASIWLYLDWWFFTNKWFLITYFSPRFIFWFFDLMNIHKVSLFSFFIFIYYQHFGIGSNGK